MKRLIRLYFFVIVLFLSLPSFLYAKSPLYVKELNWKCELSEAVEPSELTNLRELGDLTKLSKRDKIYEVGASTILFGPLDNWTYETFLKAKQAGIDAIEISASTLLMNKKYNSSDDVWKRCRELKSVLDSVKIDVWSFHMPFGEKIDISQTNDSIRKLTVSLHKDLLKFCKIFNPKVILFHPSWYLGINERNERISQLVLSVNELYPSVKEIGAIMVLENMLGYELQFNEKYERPLCRSVDETMYIFSLLPNDVYAAVDMNHIDKPELLVSALGKRVKSVHICDGDGKNEVHSLPRANGDNDWRAILRALYKDSNYEGVFMYEVKGVPYESLKNTYVELYNDYIQFMYSND